MLYLEKVVAGVRVRVDQRALCFSGQNLNIDVVIVSAVFIYIRVQIYTRIY